MLLVPIACDNNAPKPAPQTAPVVATADDNARADREFDERIRRGVAEYSARTGEIYHRALSLDPTTRPVTPLRIELSLPAESVAAGQSVALRVKAVNPSDRDILCRFHLHVYQAWRWHDDTWVPRFGEVEGLPSMQTFNSHWLPEPVPIKPQGQQRASEAERAKAPGADFHDRTFNLKFDRPGKYKIRAAWLSTMSDPNPDPNFFEGDIHSNDLIVQVAPSP